MRVEEAADIMATMAKYHPECEVTFANNKVPVSKITFDEKSNFINMR